MSRKKTPAVNAGAAKLLGAKKASSLTGFHGHGDADG